jgi:3-deoxy-D-manno-octulosonic-acid transferase
MLAVYRVLVLLALPLALAYLRWRMPGPARLRARWRERLGRVPRSARPVLWLHAASVGEVNAAAGLIEALLERHPEETVVVSTLTVTGRAEVERRFGDRVASVFMPLDTSWAVGAWLERVNPRLAMVAETEIWPELFGGCRRRGIPLVMVNARIAPRALRRYDRYRALFAPALAAVERVICQSEADAERFAELGVGEDRLAVAGNLKFDRPLPGDLGDQVRTLREQWGQRPTWVAGSTRPGEEDIVLEAHRILRQRHEDALLVLVPRHPDRAAAVRALIDAAAMTHRDYDEPVAAETAVVLIDRIGVLLPCYAAASAAFVGGSLVDIGGHNLLEPAAFGKGVIAGPHLHQQADSARLLEDAGGLVTVADAEQLAAAVDEVWRQPEIALERGRAALKVVEAGRGSVRRTLRLIGDRL